MGNQDSYAKKAEFDRKYRTVIAHPHLFFGNHVLLISKTNPQDILICKQFVFESSKQQRQFLQAYERVQRKPFSIIYPYELISNPTMEQCSSTRTANIYFRIAGNPLKNIVETEGLLNQTKAWFLLNQISKALEVLEQQKRAHWAVSPETIYRNSNGNYLLYDSLFVLGQDPSSFLLTAKINGMPIFEKVNSLIERHSPPGFQEGKYQDNFMLGLTVLFAMTGINLKNLPIDSQLNIFINEFMETRTNISKQMKYIISCLIETNYYRRMDNTQLRRLLKQKQAQIIKKQTIQYHKHRQVQSGFKIQRYQSRRTEADEIRREFQDKNYQSTHLRSSPYPQTNNLFLQGSKKQTRSSVPQKIQISYQNQPKIVNSPYILNPTRSQVKTPAIGGRHMGEIGLTRVYSADSLNKL